MERFRPIPWGIKLTGFASYIFFSLIKGQVNWLLLKTDWKKKIVYKNKNVGLLSIYHLRGRRHGLNKRAQFNVIFFYFILAARLQVLISRNKCSFSILNEIKSVQCVLRALNHSHISVRTLGRRLFVLG